MHRKRRSEAMNQPGHAQVLDDQRVNAGRGTGGDEFHCVRKFVGKYQSVERYVAADVVTVQI